MKMWERLYKKFKSIDDSNAIYSAIAEDYTDPILWTEPENGYWIENEPKWVEM